MSLPRFEFHQTASFDELFALKARYGEEARYFSGGTALVLLMRAQLVHPAALLCVCSLPGMRTLTRTEGALRIGAGMTLAEIAASPIVRDEWPVLAETFAHVATRRVRNVATLGGNLAHANPHQDPPVTLTALGAQAVVRGAAHERRIALDQLFLGYFETCLEPDEVMTAIEVPFANPGCRTSFIKYLPRSADDYATINVAVFLRGDRSHVEDIRIVIGSMGPTPIRALEAERTLIGHALDAGRITRAAETVAAAIDPEHDCRGSPDYKRRIAPVIVARAIHRACANG